MSQEKNSNKKVIALAVICILLAASLVGVIAIYQPESRSNASALEALQAELTEKQNMINSLTTQIATLQSQAGDNSETISGLNQALIQANTQYQELLAIVRLEKSSLLLNEYALTQDASTYTVVWDNILEYAGFVAVDVTASSSTTYAETIYNSYDANFAYNVTVGASGTALFPVLPGPVEIRLGNMNPAGTNNNATITIKYYY